MKFLAVYLSLIIGLYSIEATRNRSVHHNVPSECTFCRENFQKFITAINYSESYKHLKEKLHFYCEIYGLSDERVCLDTIDSYFDTIKFVFQMTPNITASKVCQIQLQSATCDDKWEKLQDWNVYIHPPVSEGIFAKSSTPSKSKQQLNILQITDIHYDLKYTVGANVMCSEPLCCRHINNSVPLKNRARKWGHYKQCDIPLVTLENALEHIKQNQKKIDIIYVTGDYVDHNQWKSSWSHKFQAISIVFEKLRQTFQHIPMYPLLGNHESNPTDEFSPMHVGGKQISTQPLYHFLINKWDWLPKEAKNTIGNGGYYTLLIRPGLRLIAINNNVCMTDNWWLLYKSNYNGDLLQWLENTLFEAEQAGEYVHILAHIPSGFKHCYREWSHQYNRIIERYYNTISAQFNGHTHRDQFNIHFSKDNPFKPINVAWNGGSIATWNNVNPNYRMYTVEPETFQVTDHETWIFNLTEANANETSSPQWFSEYKFQEAYQTTDLSPVGLYNLVQNMARNVTLLEKYFKYFVKQGDPLLRKGCNSLCMSNLLCQIVTTEFNDLKPRCSYLNEIFRKYLN